ncbi:YdcF family protein [Dyella sp. A6]|uniref:YdcF family protein n=1 Tax=Dyella aluminiiresistens TaxID=3069105 RepID=UPI002E78C9DD|nr:YdcF family protein [Dyella sp. A6]
MVLALFVVGLALAALLAWLHRRRWAWGLVGVLAALFLLAACGPLPRWLLQGLQRPYAAVTAPAWEQRNAIVLLGAGTELQRGAAPQPTLFAYGRIVKAAALYRSCKTSGQQCLLLVSGGDSQHHHVAEATVYAGVLRSLGVPAQDLQLESKSRNTWQNAQFSRPLLQAWAPRKVVLVTSGVHMRRSLLYFAHFGIRPVPVVADHVSAIVSFWPLAWNLAACDVALHEYLGIARYYEYEWMGWNAPPLPPLTGSR